MDWPLPTLNRRGLLKASAALLAAANPGQGAAAATAVRPADHLPHLSIGDIMTRFNDQEANRKRFAMYRDLGIGLIRQGIAWDGMQSRDGKWGDPRTLSYLHQIQESGFKFKMFFGVWSVAPPWFLDAHPDAKLIDEAGNMSWRSLSPWYPGVKALLAEKTETLFQYLQRAGLLENVAFVLLDLGPTAEPIYPPAWTMNKPDKDQAFWFYGPHANESFAAWAKVRYGDSLGKANRAWGASFASFDAVEIPHSRTHPGEFWSDILTWYFDSKRDVIRAQIATGKDLVRRYCGGRDVPLVMMVPGSHMRPGELAQAVASGDGDSRVKVAGDTEFLLTTAHETGCWLQHTGCEDEAEIRYIREFMRQKGYTTPLWGENAAHAAVDPGRLADIVIRNDLFGLEYISANVLFEKDAVTPTPLYPKFAEAMGRLRAHFSAS